MNTFQYHIKGIVATFEQLSKGRFLIFFIPGVVITLIYFLFHYYTTSAKESMMLSSDYSWIDWTYGYINSGVQAVFSVFDLILEQVYVFIILTILSPFNTVLGERLDTRYTGTKFESGVIRFINDIIRMIFVVIIALILEITCIFCYWVLSWFIDLGPINDVVYFIIIAFFYGFAFYDFALERYEINVMRSLGFAMSKPLAMILTGSIFVGIYSIPVVGIPIAPVVSLMVSTIVYLYLTKKLPLDNTKLKEPGDE
jgi:CysZ protein